MDANSYKTKRRYQSAMPMIDEGWWESVLAEERRHTSTRPSASLVKPAVLSTKPEPGPVATTAKDNSDALRDLYSNDRIITMNVVSYNRGGLLVEKDGLTGFIPFSHLVDVAGRDQETDRDVSLESYIGKTLSVKLIEYVPDEGRTVFSERAALAEPGKRDKLFQTLQSGSRVVGIVTNITDFGVFVDLGGVEGLIHISELSWGRVSHPSQIVKLGKEIQVQVLEISPERCRVALSLKRLTSNPWEHALANFPVGTIHKAVITSVMSYGAFARIEAGVEGLIHGSAMLLAPNQTPREVLFEGQEIQVRILHLDAAHQRLGLSLSAQNE